MRTEGTDSSSSSWTIGVTGFGSSHGGMNGTLGGAPPPGFWCKTIDVPEGVGLADGCVLDKTRF